MKKLVLFIILVMISTMSFAEIVEIDGIYYEIIKKMNSASVVSGENKYFGEVVIPKVISYDGVEYSITSIGNNAFEFCRELTAVTIPNSVTNIGDAAFIGCTILESVTIPNSVISIGNSVFGDCRFLSSIEIPNSVTSIGSGVFFNCDRLISISIPDGIKSIGNGMFQNCTALRSVTLPESLISIGDNAFYRCKYLSSISIPDNVSQIGNEAFYECTNLSSIIIPNSLVSIGSNSFYGCSSLTSFKIPHSATNISSNAFSGCSNLKFVYITNLVTWCEGGFGQCFPNPYQLFYNEQEIENLSIPDEVTFIANYTFQNCSNLKSIVITNGVKNIGTYTFKNCSNLKTIEIPNSVTEIGHSSFQGCSNLTSIEIPNSLTSLNSYLFRDCTALTSVIIPNSVTNIAHGVFQGCTKFSSISIPRSVNSIGNNAFNNCPELTDFYCYVKNIPEKFMYAFETEYDLFSGSYVENATLHVPANSIETYKSTAPWSEFGSIVPLPQFKLIYNVDGQEYKVIEIEEGETISAEAEPSKDGYTFSGWSVIPETMPAHDVTVTGTFTINKYNLTYMVDGVEYKTIEVEYGSALTPIDEPTKTGYTFTGWVGLPETMPSNDVTVVGGFSINSYTITYVVDGVEYKTATIDYGATITPESNPTKEGYTFSGWSEIPATMPASDVTVIGSFSINRYTIIYIVDGVEYKTVTIDYGSAITAETVPTKEGYTFSGWSEIPETMPANNVTVTGTFSVNSYKVTFVYGDSVLTTIEVNYGAAIELPTSLNSERYTLIEWKDVPDTMPAHDITIYADYVDGINTITADRKDEQYIRMNGMYTPDLKPGLNIIRMKDGTTKKVWVK